ncbi:hypothetical protein POVWA2_058750 [Plasmodium ovale wallikeri]|uniref:Uncharacterized protein n=1 Tax=Plasmodium ovale wallikeri TaxID=864142 RepID=A0A1A9A0L0_PLAOA|nr:hypothetical protein POVWA2_058750 [Plasmodium ovale wallikeri]
MLAVNNFAETASPVQHFKDFSCVNVHRIQPAEDHVELVKNHNECFLKNGSTLEKTPKGGVLQTNKKKKKKKKKKKCIEGG